MAAKAAGLVGGQSGGDGAVLAVPSMRSISSGGRRERLARVSWTTTVLSGGSRGGASRRTFGGDAFALHQKDGLVGFAREQGVIAFDEHAEASVRQEGAGGKRNANMLTLKYP